MDPTTGKFHELHDLVVDAEAARQLGALEGALRPAGLVLADGSPVPDHWPVFRIGMLVTVEGHTFKVAWIGRDAMLLQPVPLELGAGDDAGGGSG